MNQAVGKRESSSPVKVSPETTHMRRRLARADSLFTEGLARLQADYRRRVKAAALGESDQDETSAATEGQNNTSVVDATV